MGVRAYDPALDRFLQQDEVGNAAGQPYAYVANSPTSAVDPTGRVVVAMAAGCALNVLEGWAQDTLWGTLAEGKTLSESWEAAKKDTLKNCVWGAVGGGLVGKYLQPWIARRGWEGAVSDAIDTGGSAIVGAAAGTVEAVGSAGLWVVGKGVGLVESGLNWLGKFL